MCSALDKVYSVLAPTLQTDLRASLSSFKYMMDASPYGDICRAAVPTQELWRRTGQGGGIGA